MDAHMCPCGTTMESGTHIVEYEICKEERDAFFRGGDEAIRRM